VAAAARRRQAAARGPGGGVAMAHPRSAALLAGACRRFAAHCARGIEPDVQRIAGKLRNSLMLLTALDPHVGYEEGARISLTAHRTGLTLCAAALQLESRRAVPRPRRISCDAGFAVVVVRLPAVMLRCGLVEDVAGQVAKLFGGARKATGVGLGGQQGQTSGPADLGARLTETHGVPGRVARFRHVPPAPSPGRGRS